MKAFALLDLNPSLNKYIFHIMFKNGGLSIKKYIFLIVLLILGIGLIGSVSAADSNQTDEIITNEESIDEINTIEINDPDESVLDKTSEEILEVNEDENKLEASYQ